MTQSYKLWLQNREFTVDKIWREGGEARIYELTPKIVAKIYHTMADDVPEKIKFLVRNQPASVRNGCVGMAWAWPQDAILDPATGQIVGYVMPRILNSWPIELLFDEQQRKQQLPKLRAKHFAEIAANIWEVVRASHERGIVLGDISPKNLLFDSSVGVAAIDLDSARVTAQGVDFPCVVATPEYLAPELGQLDDFASASREWFHDVFSAAAVTYQLLTGGVHFCEGVAQVEPGCLPPNLANRVSLGAWPHSTGRSPAVHVDPPPHAFSFDGLGSELQQLLQRCFDEGFNHPEQRPRPVEWRDALRRFAFHQQECRVNPRHSFHRSIANCPWCEVTQMAGRDPFSKN